MWGSEVAICTLVGAYVPPPASILHQFSFSLLGVEWVYFMADGRSPIGWRGSGGLWGGMGWDIDLPQASRKDIYSILSVWGISPSQVLLAGMEVPDPLGRYCGGKY